MFKRKSFLPECICHASCLGDLRDGYPNQLFWRTVGDLIKFVMTSFRRLRIPPRVLCRFQSCVFYLLFTWPFFPQNFCTDSLQAFWAVFNILFPPLIFPPQSSDAVSPPQNRARVRSPGPSTKGDSLSSKCHQGLLPHKVVTCTLLPPLPGAWDRSLRKVPYKL